MPEVKLPDSWKHRIQDEFSKDYMVRLRSFLVEQKQAGKMIYPRGSEYFRAMDLTDFENVKVVILGQDPYHGPGQAHGLSFSVKPGVQLPPSLVNIYKELQEDLGIHPVRHGFLEKWASQGVLLLNSVLTVEHKQAASHQGQGWEMFTDRVIRELNDHRDHLVFILWGSYAQRKGSVIDISRHLVIKSPHPSPLSAYRGFFGSRPFSRANDFLVQNEMQPINWQLDEVVEQVAEPA
ncbi:uracil-DNA glycosylase [Sansalvadorimonas sp. 2012CJ34-2]|uniref:Uracil-DNA glycosylase n=1 Tax=Parendozoicomonas callyspongiae TaxID=2942213 RepID=A0ABT0PGM6_9GAMM|nr:uracil-DNA glycosylase [Sansalvadorimonas sp. 2012CJ34-2]MCL6270176.1 uracil-DNA glycosylase [Sansalvadorimonas sp. 2012CJ34-2]